MESVKLSNGETYLIILSEKKFGENAKERRWMRKRQTKERRHEVNKMREKCKEKPDERKK